MLGAEREVAERDMEDVIAFEIELSSVSNLIKTQPIRQAAFDGPQKGCQ